MPKVRRRCALCDAPLPDTNPTNTCPRCQDEEAERLAVARSQQSIVCPTCGMRSYNPHDISERYCGNCQRFHAEMLSPRPVRGFASIVPVPHDFIGHQVCDRCHRPIFNITSICHPRNPIFDCPFGLRNEPHRHHFCACGHEVITVRISLAQEAENGTPAEHPRNS